jgi:hypothetical protein
MPELGTSGSVGVAGGLGRPSRFFCPKLSEPAKLGYFYSAALAHEIGAKAMSNPPPASEPVFRFKCRAVDVDFIDKAPVVLRKSIDLPVPAATVFEYFKDGGSWPKWFTDMKSVVWTTPEPFGVGTERTVTFKPHLAGMALDEYFIRWQEGHRFTFYAKSWNLPLLDCLVEDYLLKDNKQGGCKYTYTIAYEPRLMLKAGFVAKPFFSNMQARAGKNLQKRMLELK